MSYLTLNQMMTQFEHDPNVRFREETVGGVSFTIVCYMLSDDELWKKPLGIETRGVTFYTISGELAALPFEKFFNVGEKAHTQFPTVSAAMSNEPAEVCLKVDGSMIIPVIAGGKIYLKTKKTFESDVAKIAQSCMTPELEDLINYFIAWNVTPIFEFTHPDCKIVVDYGLKPQFTLLAARDMDTGAYLSADALDFHANAYGIERPTWFHCASLEELVEVGADSKGIEGWVLYHAKGRYKLKTGWYLDRHRLIDVRERDIARFVLEETLDDLIPNLIDGEADMSKIREIEHTIVSDLAMIYYDIETLTVRAMQCAGQSPTGSGTARRTGFIRASRSSWTCQQ